MLRLLQIKNYALIESLELEFGQGLTVLTGETGAGKSIILDAIAMLTGSRPILKPSDRRRLRGLAESLILPS